MLEWSMNSWIIVLVGFLTAISCSLLGVFLILRKMSLVADAISHAVLPGIAIAFLFSGSRDPIFMLVGAGTFGLLATFLIEWVHRSGKIQSDAAIGIVFTTLFAIGVILISAKAGMVDLDQDCVLYGEIAYSPWDTLMVGGLSWGPRPLWILGFVTVLNLIFVAVFFKELKLSTFDPALATALGFSAVMMHYILMGLVSLTTVAAFESVGAILVIAMFVVPASTAYLLTDKLSRMVWYSVINSAIISIAGYGMAKSLNASIAGSMTTVSGILFLGAFLLSPRHGIIPRSVVRLNLKLRIIAEDWLADSYRFTEGKDRFGNKKSFKTRLILLWLSWRGLISGSREIWNLTPAGLNIAESIIKRHRTWEGFLHEELNVPPDHVHRAAHDVEHYLDESMTGMEEVLHKKRSDPHGSEIPLQ